MKRAERSSMGTCLCGGFSGYAPSACPGPGVGRYSRPVAYQSLYRKYRPQRFAELVGQAHVHAALLHAASPLLEPALRCC